MAGKKSLTSEEKKEWLSGLRLVDDMFMRFCLGAPDTVVGAGRLRSTYRRTCAEDGDDFGDGSAILYVNCQAVDSSPLGRVAHDFLCTDPHDMLVPQLAAAVRQAKGIEEAHMPKMKSDNYFEQKLIDMNYDSGFEDGVEQGIEQGRSIASIAIADAMRSHGVSQPDIDAVLATAQAAIERA